MTDWQQAERGACLLVAMGLRRVSVLAAVVAHRTRPALTLFEEAS